MHTFEDSQGRTWAVAINVAAARRVRSLLKIDLLALIADGMKPLGALLCDPMRLVDVLYVLCERQAKDAGVTDEQFGEAMYGDALDQAIAAFFEALVDFFPKPDAREALRRAFRKMRETRDEILAAELAAIDAIDPAKEAAAILEKLRTPGGSSGSAPESSA